MANQMRPRMRRRPTRPQMPKVTPDATLFSRKAFLDDAPTFPAAIEVVDCAAGLVTILLSITSSVDVVCSCCGGGVCGGGVSAGGVDVGVSVGVEEIVLDVVLSDVVEVVLSAVLETS